MGFRPCETRCSFKGNPAKPQRAAKGSLCLCRGKTGPAIWTSWPDTRKFSRATPEPSACHVWFRGFLVTEWLVVGNKGHRIGPTKPPMEKTIRSLTPGNSKKQLGLGQNRCGITRILAPRLPALESVGKALGAPTKRRRAARLC